MNQPLPSSTTAPASLALESRNRARIRTFALIVISVIVLDVLPFSWPLARVPKLWLSAMLNRIGLWQGEWSMFTPNPETDNGWVSAEFVDVEQKISNWHSPIWAEVNAWEKFYRFRHINFYNRLPQNTNVLAWDEFADYLARTRPTGQSGPNQSMNSGMQLGDGGRGTGDGGRRTEDEKSRNDSPASDASVVGHVPISKISLYRNSFRLLMPDDGSLPSREEEMWTTSSEFLTQRIYQP